MNTAPGAARPAKHGVPVWVLVATLLAVAVLAGGTAWFLASRADDDTTVETTATEEPEADLSTNVDDGADAPEVPPVTSDEPEPSYVRYAYVRAVTGSPGTWDINLDFFDIFTGAEADTYAAAHGVSVPSNGILYVDEDSTAVFLPLSDAVAITYNTGGVEGLTTVPSSIEQLREWAAGSTTAMPDAFRDQWKVTVAEGVVTRVEMIAVAD